MGNVHKKLNENIWDNSVLCSIVTYHLIDQFQDSSSSTYMDLETSNAQLWFLPPFLPSFPPCPSLPLAQVVGIITRHDLTHKRLHTLLDRKKQLAREDRRRWRDTCRTTTTPMLIEENDFSTSQV